MSPNALAVVFAPVLLRTDRNIQAQDAIALVPQQMKCIEYVLKEELKTVRSKLEDIDTLESAEKTTGERLDAVRASLRTARKSPSTSPVKQISVQRPEVDDDVVLEEEEEDDDGLEDGEGGTVDKELAREARALSRHLMSIHKEKDQLTFKLPMLETRQASSDEDMLSADEADGVYIVSGPNEEDAVSMDLPATPAHLRHWNKNRSSGPASRRLPTRFANKVATVRASLSSTSTCEDTSEACFPEPIPTISLTPGPTTKLLQTRYGAYSDTMTVESSYVTVPKVPGLGHDDDDDEIMV